jgi:DNA repair protein RecN (Recombination protein N)
MLTHIHIKNLAIVSALELEFAPGMTVLTGETGAGKSILIDALGLSLGERAENAMIRPGSERAEITASFDLGALPEVRTWLQEHAHDDGQECILRRVLVREGRSRSFINGSPAPRQLVQELGEMLVDIHGQHAHQSLLRRSAQRQLLDGYAGHQTLLAGVADLYRRFRTTRIRLEELTGAARDRAAKLDLLRYQLGELEKLKLGPQELEELDRDHLRLSNAGQLQEACAGLFDDLYDRDSSVHSRLERAVAELDRLLGTDPDLAEFRDLLESAAIQVQEASTGIRAHLETLELDPAQLQKVEQRLGEIHDLARKYRVKPDQLPELTEQLRSELEQLEHADVQLEQLTAEVDRLRGEYLAAAGELGRSRARKAEELGRDISGAMQILGMPDGQFSVELSDLSEEHSGAGGLEEVEFLVTANPGQPLQPLAKVASGGELSRISLAIQVVTAKCGGIPTLIFDEVDVGIGGRVAEIVGQLLRRLGQDRQVLCVTHLPQVAAQGNQHLQVTKQTSRNQTLTNIARLSGADRVAEIARMLGGIQITEQTLEHAREMIAYAQGAATA